MKKYLSILLILALCLALLSSCGSASAPEASASEETSAASAGETAAEEPADPAEAPEETAPEPAEELAEGSAEEPLEDSAETPEAEPADAGPFDPLAVLENVDASESPIQFPVENGETLSIWMSIPDMLINDLPEGMPANRGIMAMTDYTGVELEWTQVTATLAATQFPLMVAGGDFTDMMFNVSSMYTTGVDAAVDDDVFLDLTDYLEEYAPRYYALSHYNEDTIKECTTTSGRYVVLNGFANKPATVENGLAIRQDFLDKLGLDIPVTYDDYHDVLTAFKNELGVAEPMYLPSSGFFNGEYFVGGYGIAGKVSSMPFQNDPWYQVDGEVRLGSVQPEFKDYLTMLHQWYEEGLFAPDFVSMNKYDSDQNKNASDTVGLFFLEVGMGWPTLQSMEKENPDWAVTPVAEPVLQAGDIVHFADERTLTSGGGVVLSTQCEDIGLALSWCDAWFTREGQLAANYGLEGESYTLEDGEPVFTELALTGNNLNVMYSLSVVPTIYYRDKLAYTYTDFENLCYDTWTASRDDAYTYSGNAVMTAEESEEYAAIMSDIHTYMEENIVKFINGDVPLDTFESYVTEIEGMGLDRVTEIKQAALDRYLG